MRIDDMLGKAALNSKTFSFFYKKRPLDNNDENNYSDKSVYFTVLIILLEVQKLYIHST